MRSTNFYYRIPYKHLPRQYKEILYSISELDILFLEHRKPKYIYLAKCYRNNTLIQFRFELIYGSPLYILTLEDTKEFLTYTQIFNISIVDWLLANRKTT